MSEPRPGLLDGLVVLDFAQFLAGPMAALRLADLGATVTKVERPGRGEAGRDLRLGGLCFGAASGLFQTINRNKDSIALDLKDPADLDRARALVDRADVVIQNFRPTVMTRLGLGYDQVRERNPGVVYASVSGYGDRGAWADLPGQDLLVQARSGLLWLSGDAREGQPVPVGVPLIDVHAGALLTQGILAALVRRSVTALGAQVDTSLLEAALDLQFQELTSYLNGAPVPGRASTGAAHVYLDAPYGVYRCSDGWLALAMTPLTAIATALDLPELSTGSGERDVVMAAIAARLAELSTEQATSRLDQVGAWAAKVLGWQEMFDSGVPEAMELIQDVATVDGGSFRTPRCPIRVDGAVLRSDRAAPHVGPTGSAPTTRHDTSLR